MEGRSKPLSFHDPYSAVQPHLQHARGRGWAGPRDYNRQHENMDNINILCVHHKYSDYNYYVNKFCMIKSTIWEPIFEIQFKLGLHVLNKSVHSLTKKTQT